MAPQEKMAAPNGIALSWFAAALAAALFFFRVPDALLHPAFWAEDGTVFFDEWRKVGLGSFLIPYAGYLHLLPRSIAAFAGLFPLDWTVGIFFWASFAITVWVSFVIATAIGGVAGVVCSLAPILAFGASEVLATPTNLQWILAIGLFVTAISRFSCSAAILSNRTTLILFASLSGPFSVFSAPIYLVRLFFAVRAKNKSEAFIAALSIILAAVQAIFILTTSPKSAVDASEFLPEMIDLFTQSLGGSTLAAILLSFAVVAILTIGDFRIARSGLILGAVLVTGFTAYRFTANPGIFESGIVGFRYWYIPSALTICAFGTLLAEKSVSVNFFGVLTLGLLLLQSEPSAWQRRERAASDNWRSAVQDYYASGSAIYSYPPDWQISLGNDESQ